MKKTTSSKIIATTLAVLTLLFTFCFTSFASEEKGGADVYIGSELSHFDDIAEAFTAVINAKTDSKLVLMEDWKADEKGSFGKGNIFADGRINIYNKMETVTIDLNGFSIDRGLTEARKNGSVFNISLSKKVVITNSAKRTGVITGGFNSDNGGAFVIEGSAVRLENITVSGNTTQKRGGAMWTRNVQGRFSTYVADVEIVDTVITENTAKTGGAAYLECLTKTTVCDSVITGNSAYADGGIHTEVSGFGTSTIILGGKVIIADNNTKTDGKGLMLDENLFKKVVIKYMSDRPLENGSRIVLLSKTNDRVLRITENNSENYINCYEYENDDYIILTAGTEALEYLEIVKN